MSKNHGSDSERLGDKLARQADLESARLKKEREKKEKAEQEQRQRYVDGIIGNGVSNLISRIPELAKEKYLSRQIKNEIVSLSSRNRDGWENYNNFCYYKGKYIDSPPIKILQKFCDDNGFRLKIEVNNESGEADIGDGIRVDYWYIILTAIVSW